MSRRPRPPTFANAALVPPLHRRAENRRRPRPAAAPSSPRQRGGALTQGLPRSNRPCCCRYSWGRVPIGCRIPSPLHWNGVQRGEKEYCGLLRAFQTWSSPRGAPHFRTSPLGARSRLTRERRGGVRKRAVAQADAARDIAMPHTAALLTRERNRPASSGGGTRSRPGISVQY